MSQEPKKQKQTKRVIKYPNMWAGLFESFLFFYPLIHFLSSGGKPCSFLTAIICDFFLGVPWWNPFLKKSEHKSPMCRGIWIAMLRITLRKTCWNRHIERRGIQCRKWGRRRYGSYPHVMDVQQTYCGLPFNESSWVPLEVADKLAQQDTKWMLSLDMVTIIKPFCFEINLCAGY